MRVVWRLRSSMSLAWPIPLLAVEYELRTCAPRRCHARARGFQKDSARGYQKDSTRGALRFSHSRSRASNAPLPCFWLGYPCCSFSETPSTVRPWARGFCPHGRPGPLGFGLCGRLPRHGVGGFMFNSSSSLFLQRTFAVRGRKGRWWCRFFF